jgi:hypothetical protein
MNATMNSTAQTAQHSPEACASCSIYRAANLKKLGVNMERTDYVVALAGNPNTGKSTVFNALTWIATAYRKLAWQNRSLAPRARLNTPASATSWLTSRALIPCFPPASTRRSLATSSCLGNLMSRWWSLTLPGLSEI